MTNTTPTITPNYDAVASDPAEPRGDFVAFLRRAVAALKEDRGIKQREIESAIRGAESEQRDLNPAETKRFRDAKADIGRINAQLEDVEDRLDELLAIEERHAQAAASLPRLPAGVGVIGAEPRTYEGRSDSPSFFLDIVNAQMGDERARSRLDRHQHECEVEVGETRATGTGAFTGFVPPAYLTDQYAALARAGRPFANRVPNLPLPATGMTVNTSRITTGATAASQITENSALSDTDMDDTLLTVPVVTIGGKQTVARQALERSAGDLDLAVFSDLAFAHNTELDRQIIVGDGTTGYHLGVLSTASIITTTYTDASPTVAELWPKLADAIGQVNAQRYDAPDTIVMHPRRWAWISAATDTVGRPLVAPSDANPQNAMGVGQPAATGGVVGRIQGLDVITDANIPTNLGAGNNEDRIIVCRSADHMLWGEPTAAPFTIRAEQPAAGSLGVLMVVYSYSAFTAARYPKSTAVIAGTGLVAPTM